MSTRQAEELEALEAIYGTDVFSYSLDHPDGARATLFLAPTCPPAGIPVLRAGTPLSPLEHVPPLRLVLTLSPTYPDDSPPLIQLSCDWIAPRKAEILLENAKSAWIPGLESLFGIAQAISDEAQAILTEGIELDSFDAESSANVHGLLETFNSSERRRRFNERTVQCDICFGDMPGTKCRMLTVCSHHFCTECLQTFVEVAVNDGNITGLVCPNTTCKRPILPTDVQQIVSPDMYQAYEEQCVQSALRSMPDLLYCPRAVCQKPVIRSDPNDLMCICGSCELVFCASCNHSYHGVSPCHYNNALLDSYLTASPEQQAEMNKLFGEKLQSAVRRYQEDRSSMALIKETSTPCPFCKVAVNKVEGCNKMHCSQCNTNFCYRCGMKLHAQTPYQHFNVPGPCFNKLFDFVEE